MKLASKDKLAYDFIWANYLNKESGEEELYEKTKLDIESLSYKQYKGFSDQIS